MEEGYDPIGLNNNLPQAEGLIDVGWVQGDLSARRGLLLGLYASIWGVDYSI